MLVYIDSNIIIYRIEQPSGYGARALARMAALQSQGDDIVVSDLSRVECRSHPMSTGDLATLQDYDDFFEHSISRLMHLTTALCDRATSIRAFHRFKTPDSLHLAAAVDAGCDRFLTNDHQLARFPDLTVEILQ